ncbi:MAG: cupin domain-containing protein [Acetivibrionales bacterium]|jgi:transcriptional regulator with XRE-family HTH domain
MNSNNDSSVSKELGPRIRALREEKNLKIIDVSRVTGLSSSFISQVERALVSPSIDALKKIGEALETPLSYFFESSPSASNTNADSNNVFERSPVVKENQRKILSPEPGVVFYLLNPDMSGPIEFIYNIYEPGAGTGEGQYSHVGHECGLILEGELLVKIGDKSYHLKKGDSITFCSDEPHSKTNIGKTRCVCVWANTPPYF